MSEIVEACRSGDLITLQQLLTDQSDVSIVTEGGVTLLMHAIIGAGEYIPPHITHPHTSYTLTLHALSHVTHPHTSHIFILLHHMDILTGTEVNPDGQYLEVCQLLIQYGVVLESVDHAYSRTAAHWSVYYHRDDILGELIIAGIATHSLQTIFLNCTVVYHQSKN